MLMEAKPGGPLDRFGDCKSGEQAVELYKQVVKEVIPWDYAWARDTGRPERLAGRPLRADGAQAGRPFAVGPDRHAARRHRHWRSTRSADKAPTTATRWRATWWNRSSHARISPAPWMTETFERFYARSGGITYIFNNLLLEPITTAGKQLLIAQYGSDGRARGSAGQQRIADAFIENFNDANGLTGAFLDAGKARAVIKEKTGKSWPLAVARGALGVAKGQLRQKLGRDPGHPAAR
jgi:Styrene monooxygenase A putative substrate binding domain